MLVSVVVISVVLRLENVVSGSRPGEIGNEIRVPKVFDLEHTQDSRAPDQWLL